MRRDRQSGCHPAGKRWVTAARANSDVWGDSSALTHGHGEHVDGHCSGRVRAKGRSQPDSPVHSSVLSPSRPSPLHGNMCLCTCVCVSIPSFGFICSFPFVTSDRGLVRVRPPAAGSCSSTRSHVLLWLKAQFKQKHQSRESLSQQASCLLVSPAPHRSHNFVKSVLAKQGWKNLFMHAFSETYTNTQLAKANRYIFLTYNLRLKWQTHTHTDTHRHTHTPLYILLSFTNRI